MGAATHAVWLKSAIRPCSQRLQLAFAFPASLLKVSAAHRAQERLLGAPMAEEWESGGRGAGVKA